MTKYGHRITRAEQTGLDLLYNAFSHSPQCDEYLSASAMESVDNSRILLGKDTFPLLPGGEVEHAGCTCWCHSGTGVPLIENPGYIPCGCEDYPCCGH